VKVGGIFPAGPVDRGRRKPGPELHVARQTAREAAASRRFADAEPAQRLATKICYGEPIDQCRSPSVSRLCVEKSVNGFLGRNKS